MVVEKASKGSETGGLRRCRLIRRHDRFFKWVLEQPGVVVALLLLALPEPLRRLWTGAAPEAVSHAQSLISRELREYRTDRAFRCPVHPGGPADLLVLFEHKARPERGTSWQLHTYLFEVVRAWLKRREALPEPERHAQPLATAIVVYHGRARWRLPQALSGLVATEPSARAYGPDSRYLLVDVHRTPVERLPASPYLRAAFLVWVYDRRQVRDPKAHLVKLARTALAFGLDDLIVLVYYLVHEFEGEEAISLREVLAEVMPGQEERIMQTAGELLVAQGEAQGEARGRLIGIAEGRRDGIAEGRREMLLRLLRRRFGRVRRDVVDRLGTATVEQLDAWSDRFVDAGTLDEVFAAGKPH